ncbi:PP0621 family protein [Janthinobacterium sp.]|uniref:PP0621 family protein n=1 Tax=Janthinobacterium sp. TaxID=1871054 RepID=UPI00261D7437|nr:PP0621 family protein [Janthinobacterium sp.]
MTRVLFWLALVFLVLFAIRSKIRGMQQRARAQQQPPPNAYAPPGRPQELPDAELMLCCAHCGVYYPASENVQAKGHDYCSHAHATL